MPSLTSAARPFLYLLMLKQLSAWGQPQQCVTTKPTWDESVDAQPDLCCSSLPVAGVNDGPTLIVARVVKDDLLTIHWVGAVANNKVLVDQPAQPRVHT